MSLWRKVMQMLKCPFCGDHIKEEQTLKAHSEWKHGKKIQGDVNRFKAPSYGLSSDSARYERAAREERGS